MNCSYCNELALFKCACVNPYMCTVHLGIHYSITENHPFENLDSPSNNSKLQILRSKLITRLQKINQSKTDITQKTNTLIKTIERALKEAVENLDGIIQKYIGILSQNYNLNLDFSALEEIDSSEINFENIQIDEIANEIKRIYSKNENNHNKSLLEMRTRFFDQRSGGLRCGVITQDQKILITGGFDSIIRVWDLNRNKQKFTLHGHDSGVRCLVLTNDSKFLISGSFDATVRVWDLNQKKQIGLLKGHESAVRSVCFMQKEFKIISGDLKGDLIIWDFNKHTMINRAKLPDELGCLVLLKNQSTIIAGLSRDIVFYDLFNSKITKTMKGHSRIVWCVCLTNNERVMISGSNDKMIIIWDLMSDIILSKLKGHSSFVNSLALTFDEQYIVSGSSDKTVIIWSLDSCSEVYQFKVHTLDVNSILNFKKNFLTLSRDSSIGILDMARCELQIKQNLKHFNCEFACFENDLKLVGYGSMEKACVWDFKTQSDKNTLVGHKFAVQFVEISKDGLFAISGSVGDDQNLIYWDLNSNQKLADLKGHSCTVFCGSFSDDGTTAASGSSDKSVRMWDLKNFGQKRELIGHFGNVYSIKIISKKNLLVSGGEDKIMIIWNLKDYTQYANFSFHKNIIWKILVTEDENFIISCEENDGILIWNLGLKQLESMFTFQEQAAPWFKNNKIGLDLVKKYLKP